MSACIVGGALVKVGQVEQKIGTAEREMIEAVSSNYLQPLKTFLDNDMKSYMVFIHALCGNSAVKQ